MPETVAYLGGHPAVEGGTVELDRDTAGLAVVLPSGRRPVTPEELRELAGRGLVTSWAPGWENWAAGRPAADEAPAGSRKWFAQSAVGVLIMLFLCCGFQGCKMLVPSSHSGYLTVAEGRVVVFRTAGGQSTGYDNRVWVGPKAEVVIDGRPATAADLDALVGTSPNGRVSWTEPSPVGGERPFGTNGTARRLELDTRE